MVSFLDKLFARRMLQPCWEITKNKVQEKINYMATTTAIAARCRNPKMSAVSYRLSTILFHSGTKYDDLVQLSRFGICMHPQSIVSFEEKLGEKYNAKVQFWKKILKRTSQQYFYYRGGHFMKYWGGGRVPGAL